MSHSAAGEIQTGDRFAFGDNWRQFLELVDESRILAAQESLRAMLQVTTLEGVRFLDAGCGSGLFSLAALRLGASVVSFDFDESSVGCAQELRERYAQEGSWQIHQGSVLDREFLDSLGQFDVVYSWGVLHHTGQMWQAIDNAAASVSADGRLFISIYNDQGFASRCWTRVKRTYNRSGPAGRRSIVMAADAYFQSRTFVGVTLKRVVARKPRPAASVRGRGMDRRRDLVDWVGGWPFEVAKPEQVFDFVLARGFELRRLKTCAGGLGCNEFVFERTAAPVSDVPPPP